MNRLSSLRFYVGRNIQRSKILRALRRLIPFRSRQLAFENSDQYWRERYRRGGNSGEGSYGPLARYKASFINGFCEEHGIGSAIEFGCGDGNQASLLNIRRYTGVDISEDCILWARKRLSRPEWQFKTLGEYLQNPSTAQLGLSLDVIYHLVEDETYQTYLRTLCDSASRFLLIYTSNLDHYDPRIAHIRHRPLISDMARLHPDWAHLKTERNALSMDHDSDEKYGSFADFHIFHKA